jgi:tRNA(fMet)-specific endonuclease VapC
LKYILDTDHVTLLQRGHLPLNKRLADLPLDELATTVISYEEQISGRLAVVRRARTITRRLEAYYWLQKTLDFYCRLAVLSFNEEAGEIFTNLKAEKIRVGTQDLRISAIVLANDGVLLSRNLQDFQKIPDLKIEDWSYR